MKRWAWLILLAAAAPGCLTGPEVKEPLSSAEFKQTPATVKPEQVTDANAEDVLRQLQDEIDRDRDAPPAGRR